MFIGIGLPRAYQDRVRGVTGGLGAGLGSKVSWTKPGNWHLTLKFLGDTDEERASDISDALSDVTLSAFTMQAGGAGVFPRIQHPKVIWLGLRQGADECTALASAINDALDGIGITREKKQFRPHLTLGRVRKHARDNWQALLDAAGHEKWPAFTVDRFTLWQSDLQPTGAVHTVVQEFPLI